MCCSCHILFAWYVAEQGSCSPAHMAGKCLLFWRWNTSVGLCKELCLLCVWGNGFFLVPAFVTRNSVPSLCCHHGAEAVLLVWLRIALRASGVFPSSIPCQCNYSTDKVPKQDQFSCWRISSRAPHQHVVTVNYLLLGRNLKINILAKYLLRFQ